MNKLLALLLVAGAGTAAASPKARVLIGHDRTPREAVGRHEEPLSPEELTAKDLDRLINAQPGTTGMYVVDAQSGEPLFAINADDRLNPASNVKMISTATALELLGADFKYPTRVLGGTPDDGVLHGDVYLLGSYDPTLTETDFDELGAQLASRGIHALDGDLVVGADPSRDGLYRATLPIKVTGAATSKAAATVTAPDGFDLVDIKSTATTEGGRSNLKYKTESTTDAAGRRHLVVTVSGTIGRGVSTTSRLDIDEHTLDAAYALRAAMRAHHIDVHGEVKIAELDAFIGDTVSRGAMPVELARHESAALADIVAHVNKWSINWLADRVVISAAALRDRKPATMATALDEMYGWLGRHAHVKRDELVVDTGSGLSYKTQISPHELVDVVRSASGFAAGTDPLLARAWLDSLSVGGKDGTLTYRFRTSDVRGRLVGKTGTLSTAIALSGLLQIDPARPLAFSIVTNTLTPLSKAEVRKAHEQLVGVICRYVEKKQAKNAVVVPVTLPPLEHPTPPQDLHEAMPDPALDDETAGQR